MSTTDTLLQENENYAQSFTLGNLPRAPARKVAVVACMDARLALEPMLGLKIGDANILRNAGGLASDDTLRSLIISYHLLGTREILIINHTDCGMLTFEDAALTRRLEKETGTAAISPLPFHAFPDLESNVRQQVQRVRSHPWIPTEVPVRGFIFDVKTGRLNEVDTA